MMLCILKSKYRISKVRFLVFFIVLCMMILLLSMSIQLYIQSIQSIQNIEDKSTTLAFVQSDLQTVEFDSNAMMLRSSMQSSAFRKKAESFSSVLSPHAGTTIIARGRELLPAIPALEVQANRPSVVSGLYSEALGVFHVRIEKIREREYIEADGIRHYDSTQATATLLQTLYLREEFVQPESKLLIRCNMVDENGKVPFESGKEYVIIGRYLFPTVEKNHQGQYQVRHLTEENIQTIDITWAMVYPDASVNTAQNPDAYKVTTYEDGTVSYDITWPQEIPVVLNADDPRVEKMRCWAEYNTELIPVTGISTVNALPLFSMEKAYLFEGRDINKQDNEQKRKVCLISTAFAQQNRLEIGDVIAVELYQHTLNVNAPSASEISYRILPYLGDWTMNDLQEYEIVGIYRTQEWVSNKMYFPTNTIFVPEDSLPDSFKQETYGGIYYANSLILKNGSNDMFRKEVEDAGIPDNIFVVHDGGYVQLMKSLQSMKRDTTIVLVVCAMLFFVVCISAVALMTHHLCADVRIMQRIGAGHQYSITYLFWCMIPVVGLASVAAYGLHMWMYTPLLNVIEDLYLISRPLFSNLISNTSGVLSQMVIIQSPFVSILLAGGVLCFICTLFACVEGGKKQ